MTSQCFYQTVHNCANCIHKGVGQITTIIDRIFVKSLFIFTTAISSIIYMSDLDILGIYFAHFRFFKMMHQQSFIWTSTVLTIRTHQLLVCSWKFILSNHFSRSMSLYHLVITWDVSSWNSMSSSSFRFIPHQPLLFYTLRSIQNMLFLSFCVTYLSLHKLFPPHILCMQLRLFFSTKYDILDIVGHYYFCHQNIKFTFTTIVTFKQHLKPFLAGFHIFLDG